MISADMEDLQNYLFMESVPPSWTKRAYPSTLGLSSWFTDLLNRIAELTNWTLDFNVSKGESTICDMSRDITKRNYIRSAYILFKRGKENWNFVTVQVSRKVTWQTFVIYFALIFELPFVSDCGQSNFFRAAHLSTVAIVDLAGWFFQSAVPTYRHHAANRS